MHKRIRHLNIQFDLIKEGNNYIAYSPALDMATHAKTIEKAKKRFGEAAELYLESVIESDKLDEVLTNLGWAKVKGQLTPPTIIAREMSSVAVPA
jgi:predicted RNase H-like HicB family nuclease